LRRQFKGVTGALHFFAVVGAVHDLIGAERTGHAHVGFITQNVVGPGQFGFHRRHHEFGGARAEADHGQATTRTADLLGVQGLVGHGNGNLVADLQRRQQLRHGLLRQFGDTVGAGRKRSGTPS